MNEEQLRMVARRAAGKSCPWCGESAKYVMNDDNGQVMRNAVRSVLSGILVWKVVQVTITGGNGPSGVCDQCGSQVALCPSCSNPDRRISHFIKCSSCGTAYAAGDTIPYRY